MNLLNTFKAAITALMLNKIRSSLTMLGVVIGVFAVVALVSLVKGFENYITDQFSALGSNLILVAPGYGVSGGDPSRAFTNNKLEMKHVEIIQNYLSEEIVAVSPAIRVAKIVKYKTNSYTASVGGGNEDSDEILNVLLDKGRFYSRSDVKSKARVVVLGPEVARTLFGTKNPIGEKIRIDNKSFEVIGLARSKSPTFDDRVYMPHTTLKETLGVDRISSLAMKARDPNNIDFVMKQVEINLRRDLREDEFSVFSQKDILTSVQSILNVLQIGLAAVAAISLVVGGIGIMNIMLVSVTERIREIGLRKALGATSFNIGMQFMIEAVLISVLGGMIGLFFGWLSTKAVASFVRAEVPWWAIVLSIGFSMIVGLVFGTYPAVNASRKDPIEALRYE